jgi:spore germination protein GerM
LTPFKLSIYHKIVAVRKKTKTGVAKKNAAGFSQGGRRKSTIAKPAKKSMNWVVLFWLAFAIFILGLFLFNREAISASVLAIQNEFGSRRTPEQPASETAPEPATTISPQAITQQAAPLQTVPQSTQTEQNLQIDQSPQIEQHPQVSQAVQSQAEIRDRVLYFTLVDRGGSILRVKVDRKLPASDSPMTDVVQALIAGPSGEEKQRGLISLIPPGTRMLSAAVRGNTAYISFNEDFQYNTYGVEGYAGQLRQIVFTVTEFPNVSDVQILIEGRRIDYLGEGIWIGSPLNRDML